MDVSECNGYVMACNGYVTDCDGYVTECNGYVTECIGYATECNGYVTECSGYVTECDPARKKSRGRSRVTIPPDFRAHVDLVTRCMCICLGFRTGFVCVHLCNVECWRQKWFWWIGRIFPQLENGHSSDVKLGVWSRLQMP